MRTRTWAGAVIVCLGLFLFFTEPAYPQDLRAGVEQLAAQIAKGAPQGKQLRVALADFPDLQGVTSDLGRYIASRLTTRLAQDPRFFVIERQRLGQVLAELKFSMSDLVDPAKAKQLGRMVGVEAIVVGTVSDLGNQVDIDARMIDIETNRMLLGASTTISKDQVVADMLQRGRQETVPAPSAPTVSAPAAVTPIQSLPGLRFAHKAFTFEVANVEVVGDEVKLTLVYTNRLEVPSRAWLEPDINRSYLVDNLGNRYQYAGDSFNNQRDFPPQIPERVWITFGKLRPGATSANLVLNWRYNDPPRNAFSLTENVVIRNIPLRR